MHPAEFNFGADVIDRLADTADKSALIAVTADGQESRFNFSDIALLSAKLGSSLARSGLKKGDRVIVMLPRIPEWQIALVACLKLGAIAVPCIEMLTDKDVAYRAARAKVTAAITTASQTSKFASVAADIPIRVSIGMADGWLEMSELLNNGDTALTPTRVGAEDPAILYFTSGSTGLPKGVVHPARALYHLRHSAVEWLALTADDLMWCTADTGWSKAGTSILFGPWSCGSCVLFYNGPFDALQRLRLLQKYGVTVFCASATELLRLLDQPMREFDLSQLRRTVSAGETLSEVAIAGWRQATGLTIAEAYGQTESLMLVGYRSGTDRKPYSMGKALAHNELAIIDDTGRLLPPGTVGELAIRAPNPQFMLGYWEDPDRTEASYIDGPDGRWFRTSDRAEMDADGYFYHRGRRDDVINSSGYRIGPAEVEDVLLAHPAVAECAVVGAPDAARGEIVVAFIVLRPGVPADETLARTLQDFVKSQTAPYKYPRDVRFIGELPKTLTGKIQRNVLREQLARNLRNDRLAGLPMNTSILPAPDAQLRSRADSGVSFDWGRVARHLAEHGFLLDLSEDPRRLSGGLANINMLVKINGEFAVFRRPPDGPLPKGAHDMAREHRVLSRLAPVTRLAPRSLHFCADPQIAGAPFQILEFRLGFTLRGVELAPLPDDPQTCAALSSLVLGTLAEIHSIDAEAAGLGDLGRPAGFLARTAAGWLARAEAVANGKLSTAARQVAEWLQRHPGRETDRPVLLHNDFKLDNILLREHPLAPEAVLDWDMATRGDPLVDLATLLSYWTEAADPPCMQNLKQMPTARPGFPSREAAAQAYAALTGRSLDAFIVPRVLAIFRLAVVFHQLNALRRDAAAQGAASGQLDPDELYVFALDVARGQVF